MLGADLTVSAVRKGYMALCCRPMHQSASDRQSPTRPEGCIVSLYQHHLLGVGPRITWHPWLQLQQVALRLPGRREVQRACLEIAAEQHITSISRTASACRSHRQPASPVSIGLLVLRATVGLSRCASSASAAPTTHEHQPHGDCLQFTRPAGITSVSGTFHFRKGSSWRASSASAAWRSPHNSTPQASAARRLPAGRTASRHHQHQWHIPLLEGNCRCASSASAAPCLCGDRHGTTHHEHHSHGVCLQVAPAAGITSISGTVLVRRATVGAHHQHQLRRACVEIAVGRHIMSIIRTAFACRSPASVAQFSSPQSNCMRASSASAALCLCGDRRGTTHHEQQPHGVCLQVAPAAGITSVNRACPESNSRSQ